MEEKKIVIKYSDKNIEIPKIIKDAFDDVVQNNFKFNIKFIFVSKTGKEIKNYENFDSYKVLSKNFDSLIKKAKEVNESIDKKLNELEKTFSSTKK